MNRETHVRFWESARLKCRALLNPRRRGQTRRPGDMETRAGIDDAPPSIFYPLSSAVCVGAADGNLRAPMQTRMSAPLVPMKKLADE